MCLLAQMVSVCSNRTPSPYPILIFANLVMRILGILLPSLLLATTALADETANPDTSGHHTLYGKTVIWGHNQEPVADTDQSFPTSSKDMGDILTDAAQEWMAKLELPEDILSKQGIIYVNTITGLISPEDVSFDDSVVKAVVDVVLDLANREIADAQIAAYNTAAILGKTDGSLPSGVGPPPRVPPSSRQMVILSDVLDFSGIPLSALDYRIIGDVVKRGEFIRQLVSDIAKTQTLKKNIKEEFSLVEYLLKHMSASCASQPA